MANYFEQFDEQDEPAAKENYFAQFDEPEVTEPLAAEPVAEPVAVPVEPVGAVPTKDQGGFFENIWPALKQGGTQTVKGLGRGLEVSSINIERAAQEPYLMPLMEAAENEAKLTPQEIGTLPREEGQILPSKEVYAKALQDKRKQWVEEQLEQKPDVIDVGVGEIRRPEKLLRDAGKSMSLWAEKTLKENPEWQRDKELIDRPWTELLTDPRTSRAYLARSIGENIPNLVAAIGVTGLAGVTTKNPALAAQAGMLFTHALESGFAYEELVELAGDEKSAAETAHAVGLVNALLETVPVTRLFSKMPGMKNIFGRKLTEQLAKKPMWRKMITEGATQAAAEGTTEGMQEVVVNIGKSFYKENQDLLEGVPESMFIGSLLGGGVGFISQAVPEKGAPTPEADQSGTPPELFTPTHKAGGGQDVQIVTRKGQVVPDTYIDAEGNVFRDSNAAPVTPDAGDVSMDVNAAAGAIKAEVFGEEAAPEPLRTPEIDAVMQDISKPAFEAKDRAAAGIEPVVLQPELETTLEDEIRGTIPQAPDEVLPVTPSLDDRRLTGVHGRVEERRADIDHRRELAEMSEEEKHAEIEVLRKERVTDRLTGINNQAAYEESERLAHQVFMDVDDFKDVNDRLTYEGADLVLKEMGKILKEESDNLGIPARLHGDEFVIESDNPQHAEWVAKGVQERLANTVIEVTLSDGTVVVEKGIGVSFGIADTLEGAEAQLKKDKAARKAAGLREGVRRDAGDVLEAPTEREQDYVSEGAAKAEPLEVEAPIAAPVIPPKKYHKTVDKRFSEFETSVSDLESQLVEGGGIALIPDPKFKAGEADKPGEIPQIRTKSQNPPWFQSLAAEEKVTVAQVHNAIDAAKAGKFLGKKQQRIVTAMIDEIVAREERQAEQAAPKAEPDVVEPAEVEKPKKLEPKLSPIEKALSKFYSSKEIANFKQETSKLNEEETLEFYEKKYDEGKQQAEKPAKAKKLEPVSKKAEPPKRLEPVSKKKLEPKVKVEPKAETDTQTLIDIWSQYDDTGELTHMDLVGEIEEFVADSEGNDDTAALQKAVSSYRKEQADDLELGGRGDMDAAEESFNSVLTGIIEGKPKPEAKPAPTPKPAEKLEDVGEKIVEPVKEKLKPTTEDTAKISADTLKGFYSKRPANIGMDGNELTTGDFVQRDTPIETKPKKSMGVDRLVKLVNTIQRDNPGTRNITFHVRATQAEAFGVNSVAENGIIKGGFYAGTNEIVLIAENIKDIADAFSVIRHEAVGHYGLRQLLNEEGQYDKLLQRVYDARSDELKTQYDWVAKAYPELVVRNDVRKIADEMLAHAAETKSKANILTQIYDQIIKLLNKLGLVLDTVSHKEVNALIRLSEANLRKDIRPTITSVQQPLFMADKAAFDPSDPNILFSRAADININKFNNDMEKAKKSRSKINRWFKRNLTKEGLMNKASFEIKLKSDAIKNVGEEEISYFIHAFEKAIYKTYNKSYNKMSETDLNSINEYLKGNKSVQIPQEVKTAADLMRNHLDSMSIKMLESIRDLLFLKINKLPPKQREQYDLAISTNGEKGHVPEHIAGTLQLMLKLMDNVGTYMTRSYQAFDDANWKEKALTNKELISDASDFIQENNPDLTNAEVIGAVRAILQDAKDSGNFVSMISKGTKIGSKDISITTKRKDVPAVIRRLLGEHKDPKLNFARSASKMQWYIANHYFLMNLREKGLNNFLFEKPTGEHDAMIATKGSEAMNPLNGLYATEDFRTGMEDAVNAWDGSELMRDLIRLNSMVKYGKTILSPTTQMRNFQSAAFFSILNGHFNWRHSAKAFKVAKADLFTKDEKWKAYIKDLIDLGVMHDNPYAGELRDAINDVTDELNVYEKGAAQGAKKFLGWMQRAYQVGDDFWKIIGFENELNALLKTGMGKEEARKKAAYRIRNGYPTYSMVPRAVKKLRRWPLIGTFVSFPYEIIRTSYNQAGFIAEDMKEGRTAMAGKRVIGMAIASSGAYAASKLSMLLMGMDDDDDEAVRAQLPPWSRNSQLYYIGYDDDGLPIYFDLSYLDPYTYLKKPLTALVNGNNEGFDDKILDALTEMAEPFIGTDIAAGVALEIWSNKKQSGGQLYNPEDPGQATLDILDHVRKGIQPGMISNIERTVMALKGDVSPSGREYKVEDEALGWLGFRVGTLNLSQSMIYKGYEFTDSKRSAARLLSRVAGSQAEISEDNLTNAFNSMMKARIRAYKQMIKYVNGSRSLGVDDKDIKKSLNSANISGDDIRKIIREEIPKWKASSDFIKSARDRAIVSTPSEERKEEIRDEMKERVSIIKELANDYEYE